MSAGSQVAQVVSSTDRAGLRRDPDVADVGVTDHAEWRYLERIDGGASYPSDRIRYEFVESVAVSAEISSGRNPVRVHLPSGTVYAYDPADWTVVTCYQLSPDQRARLHEQRQVIHR